MLFYYVFAIIGVIMFGETDPWQFNSLHIAIITLFRCSTLEDWTDVMYTNMYGCDVYGYGHSAYGGPGIQEMCTVREPQSGGVVQFGVVIYFLIFITIGALVLLTLFIGVVVGG